MRGFQCRRNAILFLDSRDSLTVSYVVSEMSVPYLEEWLAGRAQEDQRLYEQYGKPLEQEHTGKFVAIGSDGQCILDSDELALAVQALSRFGRGNFALRRIGYDAEIRWRRSIL